MTWENNVANDVVTRTVTCTYLTPSSAPAKGRVVFTPTTRVVDENDVVIAEDPYTAVLDATGSFEIDLPTTDNKLLTPTSWAYSVSVRLYGVKPQKFYMKLPYGDGSPVDFLSSVSRTEFMSTDVGTTAVRGPIGPRGPGVISGSGAPSSTDGQDSDLYIDTTTGAYYGPKVDGAWPASPFYAPETPQTARYTHSQGIPADEWVITHSLGGRPSVTVVDSAGTVVIGEVVYNSDTEVIARFTSPFSGYAYLT